MAAVLRELIVAAQAIADRDARAAFLVDGFVAQVFTAYRTVEVAITRTLDELAQRGLHLVFGPVRDA